MEPEEQVGNNEPATPEKKLGGCTGKGFMPGESGNPSGRPKKRPITEIYEQILEEAGTTEELKQAIRKMLFSGRMVSQLQLKEMRECIEGKITQPVELSGDLNLALSERMERARQQADGDTSS